MKIQGLKEWPFFWSLPESTRLQGMIGHLPKGPESSCKFTGPLEWRSRGKAEVRSIIHSVKTMVNREKLPQDFQGNKKPDLFQQMAKLSGERLRDLRGSPKFRNRP